LSFFGRARAQRADVSGRRFEGGQCISPGDWQVTTEPGRRTQQMVLGPGDLIRAVSEASRFQNSTPLFLPKGGTEEGREFYSAKREKGISAQQWTGAGRHNSQVILPASQHTHDLLAVQAGGAGGVSLRPSVFHLPVSFRPGARSRTGGLSLNLRL